MIRKFLVYSLSKEPFNEAAQGEPTTDDNMNIAAISDQVQLRLIDQLLPADETVGLIAQSSNAADVSVRALLLDLMVKLKNDYNLTYLFITHDLATAKYICDRIAILYLGKIVEISDLREVYAHPLHPYTIALLAAVPVPNPHERREEPMPKGEIPNPIHPPSGCRFHPRCPYAQAVCSEKEPELRELRPDHLVACHFAEQFLDS